MARVEVDPAEFNEWKRDVRKEDDDLLHAFRAIKVVDEIKFAITTEEDPVERLQKIEEAASKWL